MVRQFNKFSCCVLKRIFAVKTSKDLYKQNRFIFKKSNNIPGSFLGFKLAIYKGNLFRNLKINRFMLSLVMGSFVFNRKPHTFISKKKKKANSVRR